MPHQIVVKVKGVKNDEIYSPSMEKDESDRQLSEIKKAIGTTDVPDLPWLAVQGTDIASAHVIETSSDAGSVVSWQ